LNFNSLEYMLFLPCSVVLYYLLPHRWRNPLLLVLSYYFYMCWQPVYALLMLLSTGITFASGLLMDRQVLGKRKLWLALSFILNLSILFFFKYFNFTFSTLQSLLALGGIAFNAPALSVLLPVGISFYTFQALGYTMDVYRGDIEAERSFATYALFVSFFPQLVAGPIERSDNMLPQLKEKHTFRWSNITDGLLPILWGLFKKMVIADQLAVLVNTAYGDPAAHTGVQLAFATAAFAFQIYCDFSAYSDIAIGSAAMLGFRLMRNFNCPYLATSIKDFWRRWHISLSSWFKDYLYFPLGGSRCSRSRHWLNIMIVFAVSGLWHGAALTFVVWGVLNGAYQVISAWLDPLRQKLLRLLHIAPDSRLLRLVRICITFCLVCVTWVFFRADTIGDALLVLQRIFTLSGGIYPFDLTLLGLNRPYLLLTMASCLLLMLADGLSARYDLRARLGETVALRYTVYFLLIVALLVFGSYGAGYDPQEFVYFQF